MRFEFMDTHEGITLVVEWSNEGDPFVRGATPVEITLRDAGEKLARVVSASLPPGKHSPLADALTEYLSVVPWSDL